MSLKPYSTVTDFITGREVPNIGAEENRQSVERYLIAEKGFSREDIAVDVEIELVIQGDPYRSQLDLVVSAGGGRHPAMVIKCCAGSLASREREVLSAARLLTEYQIPFAVVSDAKTAIVLDTISGKKLGSGMTAIPSKSVVRDRMGAIPPEPLSNQRREKEKLIFRTYDSDNVNVSRNL
jgi:hypothetical protein